MAAGYMAEHNPIRLPPFFFFFGGGGEFRLKDIASDQVAELAPFLVCTHVIRRPYWCTKQKQNVACVLHNNRAKLPDFLAIVQ